jgi:hypothetical protein
MQKSLGDFTHTNLSDFKEAMAGVEPAATWSRARRSTTLSYIAD